MAGGIAAIGPQARPVTGPEELLLNRMEGISDRGTGRKKITPEQAAQVGTAFLYQMVQAMRETVPEGGAFSGGRGEGVFERQFDWEVSGSLAAKVGFGELIVEAIARRGELAHQETSRAGR